MFRTHLNLKVITGSPDSCHNSHTLHNLWSSAKTVLPFGYKNTALASAFRNWISSGELSIRSVWFIRHTCRRRSDFGRYVRSFNSRLFYLVFKFEPLIPAFADICCDSSTAAIGLASFPSKIWTSPVPALAVYSCTVGPSERLPACSFALGNRNPSDVRLLNLSSASFLFLDYTIPLGLCKVNRFQHKIFYIFCAEFSVQIYIDNLQEL